MNGGRCRVNAAMGNSGSSRQRNSEEERVAFDSEVAGDSNFVISFTKDPRSDFGVFAEGYFHAASELAEELLSRGGFADFDAYPVVFLYRHSLELYLKNIIYKSALLMAFKFLSDIDTKLHNNHDLIFLSEKAVAVLQRLFPDDGSINQLAEDILNISSEFSEIDPNSFAYRYPIDRHGNPSTRPNQVVNLKRLCCTMNKVLDDLDTLDFGLQVETNQAQEVYEILLGS